VSTICVPFPLDSPSKYSRIDSWLNLCTRLSISQYEVKTTRCAEGDESDDDELKQVDLIEGGTVDLATAIAKADGLEKVIRGMLAHSARSRAPSKPRHPLLQRQHSPPSRSENLLVGRLGRRWALARLVNAVYGDGQLGSPDHGPSVPGLPPVVAPLVAISTPSTSASTPRAHNIPLELIERKFGSPSTPSPSRSDYQLRRPTAGVFSSSGPAPPPPANAGDEGDSDRKPLTRMPHMDYRIVHGQAMRSRAKDIFSRPLDRNVWCIRHRVSTCTVCNVRGSSAASSTSSTDTARRAVASLTLPGEGLTRISVDNTEHGSRCPLAAIVPEFVVLSAGIFGDLVDMHLPVRVEDAGGESSDDGRGEHRSRKTAPSRPDKQREPQFTVTSEWYTLFACLLTCACLEGYLVGGWQGVEPIEILLGVGCGGWEGKEWAKGTNGPGLKQSSDGELETSEGESDSWNGQQLPRNLVEAARLLFGIRSSAQAEFEREMRDRTLEVGRLLLFLLPGCI
jgi:hypothetical protein